MIGMIIRWSGGCGVCGKVVRYYQLYLKCLQGGWRIKYLGTFKVHDGVATKVSDMIGRKNGWGWLGANGFFRYGLHDRHVI